GRLSVRHAAPDRPSTDLAFPPIKRSGGGGEGQALGKIAKARRGARVKAVAGAAVGRAERRATMNDVGSGFFAAILSVHQGLDIDADLVPHDPRMVPLDEAREAGEDVEFEEPPRALFCSPGVLVIETSLGRIVEVQVEEQQWVGHWPRRIITARTT